MLVESNINFDGKKNKIKHFFQVSPGFIRLSVTGKEKLGVTFLFPLRSRDFCENFSSLFDEAEAAILFFLCKTWK